MCVCYSLVFFPDCSVPSVLSSSGFFLRVPVVLVRHTDGRKVQRSRVVCNFASSFEWVVVVVFMFSCVLKIRIRYASFWLLCEISWPYNRVDPEEIVMVFNKFQSMAQNPRVCFHFESGRGSLQAWTDVDATVMLRVFCIWQLMWSCMQH